MSDEELAVDWIRSQGWSEETLPSDEFGQMFQAFLAGLKAGRPKWHYPSKGELPEDDRLVVIYYKGGVAIFGSYTNGWHNKFGDSISEPYMWISLKPPKEM